jgi:hypothetical protein
MPRQIAPPLRAYRPRSIIGNARTGDSAMSDKGPDKDDKSQLPASAKNAEVDAFLRKVAAMPAARPASGRGKLIFAMDATASREPSWDHACKIQGEMFEATGALGGLDVQLVFYRGFNECKASKWLSSAQSLHGAMRAVFCMGGETQIARVLRHALKAAEIQKVGALVFVGDAMEEKLDELCGLAGQLGLLGVPVFVFHEGSDAAAARAFKDIARLSHGAYCRFDANSAGELRALLGAVAAYAAGGHRALANYSKNAGGSALLLAKQLGGGQ